jgi:hypothetical protein
MYCPRCAKQELGKAKFCRDCGSDLESVALALEGKLVSPEVKQVSESTNWDAPNKGWEDRYNNPQTTEDWLRKQSAAMNFIVRGATLLATALVAGIVILRLFGVSVWPLIVWAAIFGWMGWWGVAYLAEGLGALMQSRNMLSRSGASGIEPDANSTAPGVLVTGELRNLPDARFASEESPRSSVTEDPTAQLNKQRSQF